MTKHLTPSQVAQYLKGTVERDHVLSTLVVEGEVCNYTPASSGHHYFSLKDKESTLPCIMFKGDFPKGFPLANGMQVLVAGGLTIFVQRGVYQLRCTKLSPLGTGDLHLAFTMMKNKLEQEGLFHPQYKKTLPYLPKKIGLITSPTGAVVWDMIKILKARCPITEIFVIPVPVQGDGAEQHIAGAIAWADYYKVADLLIVGRGGGSQEDLKAFNQESVARAIFACKTPIISAVGHEPDVSISDYVADCRGATPTHAAEIAVPRQEDLLAQLSQWKEQMTLSFAQRLDSHRRQLQYFADSSGFRDPKHHLREKAQMLDYLAERLEQGMTQQINQGKNHCASLSASLHALSPLKVMSRGYAIPKTKEGKLLHTVSQTKIGDKISLSLADGTLHCVTEEIERKE
ncbi:MAG: exodeoxyribonuclease VII large subunit [Eubacteriales bacterium]